MTDNSYNLELDCRQIFLTKGQIALVDNEDYDFLSKSKWQSNPRSNRDGKYYARNSKKELMHGLIMNVSEKHFIDHINGNTTDNRKCNLRICSHTQNIANRVWPQDKRKNGTYQGVNKQNNKWRALICINSKQVSLGYFDTPEEARDAYIKKAKEVRGEFFKNPEV